MLLLFLIFCLSLTNGATSPPSNDPTMEPTTITKIPTPLPSMTPTKATKVPSMAPTLAITSEILEFLITYQLTCILPENTKKIWYAIINKLYSDILNSNQNNTRRMLTHRRLTNNVLTNITYIVTLKIPKPEKLDIEKDKNNILTNVNNFLKNDNTMKNDVINSFTDQVKNENGFTVDKNTLVVSDNIVLSDNIDVTIVEEPLPYKPTPLIVIIVCIIVIAGLAILYMVYCNKGNTGDESNEDGRSNVVDNDDKKEEENENNAGTNTKADEKKMGNTLEMGTMA